MGHFVCLRKNVSAILSDLCHFRDYVKILGYVLCVKYQLCYILHIKFCLLRVFIRLNKRRIEIATVITCSLSFSDISNLLASIFCCSKSIELELK